MFILYEAAVIDEHYEPILQSSVIVRMAHHQFGLFSVIVYCSARQVYHFCSHNTIHYILDIYVFIHGALTATIRAHQN